MDNSTPSGSGKVVAPPSSVVTSHTLYPGRSEMDFDHTIKIKTPGTGMTVFGRYKLERVLGRGGMGVVWLADDLKLERPVALKFLPSLIGLDPAAVKELKTETRRGLELSHPHIVRIYDFVDDEDAAAISMEFVDGKTLSELRMTTEAGVFSVDDISRWLLGVCDALDYAHFQRKLIHRDLKPANIMLTGKDVVAKIADFGIARSLSDTMSRLSAAHIGTSGTLPYMSPQQAMGERPQPTDDVYSLGATLYELLSGKPPFYRGDLPTQINSKIPPSMEERRTELEIQSKEPIPRVWEEAIAACLHKEPHMRPSCAGVLAEMLALKPTTVTVRTGTYAATVSNNARTPVQKAGSRTPLIAAAATVLVGAGAAAMFFLNPAAKPKTPEKTETAFLVDKVPGDANRKSGPDRVKPEAPAKVADTPPPVAKVPEKPAVVSVPETKAPSAPALVVATPPTAATPSVSAGDSPPMTPPAGAPVGTPAPSAALPAVVAAPVPAPLVVATVAPPAIGNPPAVLSPTGPSAPAVVSSMPPAPVNVPAPLVSAPSAANPATLPMGGLTAPVGAPASPVGNGLSLTPDPGAAVPGALAGMTPPPAATPGTPPLPPNTVIPPGGLILSQPVVSKPESGFWTVEQVFPVPPHASYSPKGKRYLLYRTQAVLKEQGLYTSTVDGAEGKGTYNAIILFQVRNGLEPNGLLDLPTLAALNLSAEVDKADWNAPSGGGGGGGGGGSGYRRRSSAPKEEPNFLQRTGDTLKRLNPFGK